MAQDEPQPEVTTPETAAPAAAVSVDLTWLIRGNWLAATLTALVATVLALGISAALVFSSDPPNTSRSDQVAFSVAGAAASVTGNAAFTVQGTGDEADAELTGNGGVVPLVITLVALGAAAWVFHRSTRGYPRVGPALADALRASVIFGLMMLVVCLFGQREDGFLKDAMDLSEEEISGISWGASIATTTFLSALMLFAVLALVCLAPSGRLSPTWQRIRSICAPGVAGVTAFAMLLPVAGLISYFSVILTDGHSFPGEDVKEGGGDTTDVIALMIAAVGNAGLLFMSVGAGARVGERHDLTEFDDEKGSEWHRLAWVADEMDSWGMWLAIPTMLLVVLACGYIALRSARRNGAVAPGLAVWAVLMFAAVPLLTRWSAFQGAMKASADEETVRADAYAGIGAADSLLIPLIALAVALLLGGVSGAFKGWGKVLAYKPPPATSPANEPPADMSTKP